MPTLPSLKSSEEKLPFEHLIEGDGKIDETMKKSQSSNGPAALWFVLSCGALFVSLLGNTHGPFHSLDLHSSLDIHVLEGSVMFCLYIKLFLLD